MPTQPGSIVEGAFFARLVHENVNGLVEDAPLFCHNPNVFECDLGLHFALDPRGWWFALVAISVPALDGPPSGEVDFALKRVLVALLAKFHARGEPVLDLDPRQRFSEDPPAVFRNQGYHLFVQFA